MTMENIKKELIEKAHNTHKIRLELGICEEHSLQSLAVELDHIKDPKLSDGRK